MEKPLITVITLSYHSTHLLDAIRSVLEQSYPAVQLIIADDGTLDFDQQAVYSFVEANKSPRLKSFLLLHSADNCGTVANYNNALRHADGEYIFPLAADDLYCSTETLTRWTDAFIASGMQVFCACCDKYDESMTKFLGRWPRPDHIRLLNSQNCDEIYAMMESQKILPGCCMARTKASLSTLGYFDEQYRLLEDYPFMMRLLRQKEPIGIWPQSAIKHRVGGVSDGENTHPQLVTDMERFYEVDLFPYAQNPAELRHHLAAQEKKKQEILTFDRLWRAANLPERLILCIKKPKLGLRKVYHILQR